MDVGRVDVLLCALLLVATAAAQVNSSVKHSLEPHATAYHPLRHHQRPNDTSNLRYYTGKLDDNEDETPLDDRRGRMPGYSPPNMPQPPMGEPGYGPGSGGGHGQGDGRRHPLKVLYGWTEIDFTWPSPQARRDATNSGAYQSHNIIPLDVDVYRHNGRQKIFVTMPRGAGVPVALATLSSEGRKRSPKLAPYPDWSWHGNNTNCQGISSVYRIMVDECDRLWVLDRGDDAKCKPQMLLFDLRTDQLISQYTFPNHVIRNGSNLITVSVDIRRKECAHAFAYIADVTVPAIVVFDAKNRDSWRVEDVSMRPEERYATYRIAGREFYLTDGVFGLALGPLRRGDRTLYYHALASLSESSVPTSVLRDKALLSRHNGNISRYVHTAPGKRASQSAAQVMDHNGILYSGLLSEIALTCWNSETTFGGWNLPLIAADEQALQFPSGMKINNGNIWIMTSRYQNFATDTMDWNDVNYRILSGRLDDLIRGTSCEHSSSAMNGLG